MSILSKSCETYKIENAGIVTIFSGWGGICLYTQQKSKAGDATTKAVSIKENAVVSNDEFKLPKGIRVK